MEGPASTDPAAITVVNESGITCDEGQLSGVAAFLLPRLGLHPSCILGITLVDPVRMEQLHVEWMDETGPTDVLSFPMDELRRPAPGEDAPLGTLGDIVLCPDFVRAQAVERGRTLDEELVFLTTHGVLHLLGYDHATEEDYAAMFALQDELLAEWGAA